jgi:hypothetical protein
MDSGAARSGRVDRLAADRAGRLARRVRSLVPESSLATHRAFPSARRNSEGASRVDGTGACAPTRRNSGEAGRHAAVRVPDAGARGRKAARFATSYCAHSAPARLPVERAGTRRSACTGRRFAHGARRGARSAGRRRTPPRGRCASRLAGTCGVASHGASGAEEHCAMRRLQPVRRTPMRECRCAKTRGGSVERVGGSRGNRNGDSECGDRYRHFERHGHRFSDRQR